MSGVDLSLISIKELCEEICNRCETAIIYVIPPNNPDNTNAYFNWRGDYYKALGLCSEMENEIKRYTGEPEDA